MKIKMQLLSDAIFGNGASVPGGEDISVLHDEYGFPYYKGSTFKGILREDFTRTLEWEKSESQDSEKIAKLFGAEGDEIKKEKLVFSDFTLDPLVRQIIWSQLKEDNENVSAEEVLALLTNVRTFTSMTDAGVVKEGSLRTARCVDKGLTFYSQVECPEAYESLVKEVIQSIKWIGTMRNRGFGKVRFTVE